MSRWNYHGSLVEWQITGLGCNLCRPSYLSITASEVCAAANQAEQTKIKKYSYLTSLAYHSFTPVATGVCGPRSMSFLSDLGRRIANTTDDKSTSLMQKFSVAIQRGNAESILGTLPPLLSMNVMYFGVYYSVCLIINKSSCEKKQNKPTFISIRLCIMCYPVDFQDGVEMTWNKLPTSVIWDLADNVMTHQKAYKNLSQGFQMKLGLEDSV